MRALLLCLMTCGVGWSQTWKPWPMQDQWGKQRAAYLGTLPRRFAWKDLHGHSLSVRFLPKGHINSEGSPERLGILAEDSTAHARSSWSILDSKPKRYEPQRRIYEPFCARGAGIQLLDLGAWQVWELDIGPTTNGAPPNGLFWIIQRKGSTSLVICGASSYGVLGYRIADNQLELRSIGESASYGSIEILSWIIKSKGNRLEAVPAPPSWLFVLGGLDSLVLAPSKQLSDHKGVRMLSRPILRSDLQGGEAASNNRSFVADTTTYLKDWSLQIPHYSTDDWAELHWAWVSEWNVGPKRAMVAPSAVAMKFRWAQEVRVFDPIAWGQRNAPRLSPSEAARMANAPGWDVVLAQYPGALPEAVALISPEY